MPLSRIAATLLFVFLSFNLRADINSLYQSSVQDAAFARSNELVTNLWAVNAENPNLVWNDDKSKIKVVTWKSQSSYDNYIKPYQATSDNPGYAVWVTLAPQVQNMCRAYAAAEAESGIDGLNMRLRQYLGLAPSWQYDVFVELWVDPADLFRPCVDPQTDDSQCDLHFGSDNPMVKGIVDYKDFYENLYYKSFRASAGVPWTGLGYTFDWNADTSEVGASEYILVPETQYQIEAAVPTAEYCQAL